MPKRCIGIDLGRSHVCAAQVVQTAAGVRLEKAFATQTRRSVDSLPAILRSLTNEHGFDRRAEVAVCLPHQAFFFADMETDAPGLERIRASDTEVLKDHFPLPAQDLVAQVCSVVPTEGGKSSVLVAASSRQQLAAGLHALREGRIKPACLDTPIAAGQATILTNHPESAAGWAVLLSVDPSTLSLAVTCDGRLRLVRNIPLFAAGDQDAETFTRQTADLVAQEIEITWQRLFGQGPDPGLRIFLIAPRPLTESLRAAVQDKTGGQVLPVDPYAQVTRGEEVDADLPVSVAEGLALRALQPEAGGHTDFLGAYRVQTRPPLRLTKELAVCGGLAAAAAVVWTAGLFLQRSSLEATQGQLKKQMAAVFRQAVPEEQNIVDPAAQLQQRLDAFRKEGDLLTSLHPGRSAPLEILYALSRSTPAPASLKLQDVLIAGDSVQIKGSCDSFATLTAWQRQLGAIPGLQVVEVPHRRWDAQSAKVQFTIALSTRENKA